MYNVATTSRSPIQENTIETFILYAIGVSLGIFSLYLLGVFVAPFAPDPVKNDHFECGLPTSSEVPKKANFGFFMFAIMFVIADMTGLFFTLFVFANDLHAQSIAVLFAIIMALAIMIAMKEYHHAENI